MEKIKAYITKHPWQVGAIVVFGGLAFLVFSGILGGGGSTVSSTGAPVGPDDAQVAAQTQLQVAQIGASVAVAGQQSQLDLATIQAQNNKDLAQIASDTQINQDTLDAHSTDLATTTALQALIAQITGQTQQAQINSDLQESLYGMQVDALNHQSDNQTAINLANIGTQQQAQTYNYNLNTQQLSDNYDLNSKNLDYNYQLSSQSISSNERITANQQATDALIASYGNKKSGSSGLLTGVIGSLF